ncbi:MAG TPA: M28 family peptidase [Lentimicrobium sp.]|nr:M28 family peptidase [Lentimicrobium sp.]
MKQSDNLVEKSRQYLQMLCDTIPGRCVGSEGNRMATGYFSETLKSLGWEPESPAFDAIDWTSKGAKLTADGQEFSVHSSPYSRGCDTEATLIAAGNLQELEVLRMEGCIVLLHGELAVEQLMPKNFVFYNPEHHRKIIARLEAGKPAALVCATGFNPELAGGVYPFPLIEDGDFDIPSVFTTEEIGTQLLKYTGEKVRLVSDAVRIPGKGYNITALKGKNAGKRIVVSAHIDAKKGTPGAIDNATGVIVLLLLAEMLRDYNGDTAVELAAFNGEDYYAVPGQMLYISENQDSFDQIILNINIDGAGYHEGGSAYSLFDLPENMEHEAHLVFGSSHGFWEGPQWPQGDHSIFVQYGCPAIAITSEWFLHNMYTQRITHTPGDHPRIVNPEQLPAIAEAILDMIKKC